MDGRRTVTESEVIDQLRLPLIVLVTYAHSYSGEVAGHWLRLLAGQTLSKLNFGRRFGVHVVSVLRGNQRLNIPSGNTAILPGDHLQVIGTDEQLSQLASNMESEVAKIQKTPSSSEEMQLQRLVIVDGSRFVGQNIQQSGIRQDFRCLIAGLEQDDSESLVAPNPQTAFQAGDVLWVVGEEADLVRLEAASRETGE